MLLPSRRWAAPLAPRRMTGLSLEKRPGGTATEELAWWARSRMSGSGGFIWASPSSASAVSLCSFDLQPFAHSMATESCRELCAHLRGLEAKGGLSFMLGWENPTLCPLCGVVRLSAMTSPHARCSDLLSSIMANDRFRS